MSSALRAGPAPWKVSFGVDALLALALGAVQTLAYVHTATWWLPMLCIAALAWRVGAARPVRAAFLGLLFGSGWLVTGTWWLYVSMHRYGGLPAPLAAAAVLLLSAFLSLYLAAAMVAFARGRRGRPATDALLFAAVWLLAELARAVIFTGFPWAASGYAQVDAPLAALAPWVGVYGIGAVAAGLSAWIGLSARSPGRWRATGVALAGSAALLLVLSIAGPGRHTQPTGTLRLTLLQGNVPQDEKFSAEHLPEQLDWTLDHLLGARGDLVLAPETVIPLLPDQLDPGYWKLLLGHFQGGRQAALFGLPLGDEATGYSNSAAGISAATKALPGGFYRYDKHHLVPFGEFIPRGFRWFTELMNIPLGDFNRGALAAPSFVVRGERVAANICYEDLFGEELAARFTDPANAPTLFANLSNIGWFGDTVAVPQHLQISRMRTLEFQLPMVRATNTGATAVIDADGRVTAALAPHTQGVLEAPVQGRQGLTPFARWASRAGLWPLALLAGGVALVTARNRRP